MVYFFTEMISNVFLLCFADFTNISSMNTALRNGDVSAVILHSKIEAKSNFYRIDKTLEQINMKYSIGIGVTQINKTWFDCFIRRARAQKIRTTKRWVSI